MTCSITIFGRSHLIDTLWRFNGFDGRVRLASRYHQHYFRPRRLWEKKIVIIINLHRTRPMVLMWTTFVDERFGIEHLPWVLPTILCAWYLSCSCRLSIICGRLSGYGRLYLLGFRSTLCTPVNTNIEVKHCQPVHQLCTL